MTHANGVRKTRGNETDAIISTGFGYSLTVRPPLDDTRMRPTRLDRRKARTRQALIDAARSFLAGQGRLDVSIQEITDAADVGFGSFYNHFAGKTELLEAAITDVLEEHGKMLDERTAHLKDPAEVFAASLRLTARLVDSHPQIAGILAKTALPYLADNGLAPRALRDIQHGIEAGRFHITNPYVALVSAGGALQGLMHLRLERPDLAGQDTPEELAEQLLRAFGMTRKSAHTIAHRPLPVEPTTVP